MPRISLTSRHATRPNSKKSLAPHPPPPHNTTHKNARHIGLHQQHTVPQHHNYICTPHNVHHTTATQNITPHNNTRPGAPNRGGGWGGSQPPPEFWMGRLNTCQPPLILRKNHNTAPLKLI